MTDKIYKRQFDPTSELLLKVGLVVLAFVALALGDMVFIVPSSGWGPVASNFVPSGVFLVALCLAGLMFLKQHRSERLEADGSKFNYYRWTGRATGTFDLKEISGIKFRISILGRRSWELALPDRTVKIPTALFSAKESAVSLFMPDRPNAGDLDGDYVWQDRFHKKYGAVLTSVATFILAMSFTYPPLTKSVVNLAERACIVLGFFVLGFIGLRAAGTMTFERVEVLSGTYSYFDWKGSLVREFTIEDFLKVEPSSSGINPWEVWTLYFSDGKIRFSEMLGVKAVVDDIQRQVEARATSV